MPCPFFFPADLCDQSLWPFPARLPLGAGYSGRCMAPGHEGSLPSDDELKRFCNMGYSTGCERLPEQRAADANRFFVRQNANIKDLTVDFCSERQHLPVEHAILIFHCGTRTWTMVHANACVQRQAECAVESYLRRREEREEHDFSRAVNAQESPGALAPAAADGRRPTADDLANDLANDQRPTTNDYPIPA